MDQEKQNALWTIQAEIMKEMKKGPSKDKIKFTALKKEYNRMVNETKYGSSIPKETVPSPIPVTPKEEPKEPKVETKPFVTEIGNTIKSKIGLKPKNNSKKKSKPIK